ncbi:hypothetical protein FisN_3Hh292 [Fistulifera solaris]|jgi:hypothetical protein|uniref:Uncharacterized protein n=1 Tax=Fistulifera solaris TaxID=1519565 RepID=A0A1Z5JQP5_FISSO|nr:hypothetical protein FisN_3Hh292 [Fistulifera solaris]|eukprot:GAX16226.1 hypothetical protein FisN_3Hh292 [Fistulifera solaris]
MSSQTDENLAPVENAVDAKRPAETVDEPTAKRACSDTEVLDLAETMKYKAGDRFQVKWEISSEDKDEVMVHWWSATLLKHDGRTTDSVAIRVLDYDPFPEGGFPDRSQEDVIFLGRDTLANPETGDELTYRVAGSMEDPDEDEILYLKKENVEEIVNSTLEKALAKNSEAWARLTPAQQAVIASGVADKKKKLLDLLLNFQGGVIKPTDLQSILAKTMQEDSK